MMCHDFRTLHTLHCMTGSLLLGISVALWCNIGSVGISEWSVMHVTRCCLGPRARTLKGVFEAGRDSSVCHSTIQLSENFGPMACVVRVGFLQRYGTHDEQGRSTKSTIGCRKI